MHALLKRIEDGAIVAAWQDNEAKELPPAPDGHEYVETTADRVREVTATLIDDERRPQWRLEQRDGEALPVFEPAAAKRTKRWFLIARTSDNAVIAGHESRRGDEPDAVLGSRVVECSEEDYRRVSDAIHHPSQTSVLYAWRMGEGDTLEPIPDTRTVVQVSAAATVVELPGNAVLTFSVDGLSRGSQRLALEVVHDGSSSKRLVTIENGTAVIDRQLPAGSYELRSGQPDEYLLEGDTRFEVVESW